MSIDFEKPVNNEADMLAQGRHLYLPGGTSIPSVFVDSPIAAQKEIGMQSLRLNKLYYRIKGKLPHQVEDEMINKGKGYNKAQN